MLPLTEVTQLGNWVAFTADPVTEDGLRNKASIFMKIRVHLLTQQITGARDTVGRLNDICDMLSVLQAFGSAQFFFFW
jgi:hypothetical protein